jgi:hypothetical protein
MFMEAYSTVRQVGHLRHVGPIGVEGNPGAMLLALEKHASLTFALLLTQPFQVVLDSG